MTDGKIKSIVKKSLDPFIWFGGVCMAVSGLWLLYGGQWHALALPIMAFIFSPFIFPVLMMPAGFCAGVMMVTEKQFPRASRVFAALTFVWFVTLMSGYPVAALLSTGDAIDAGYDKPALLWALSAGITPWAFFSTRDRGNVFFTGLVYMSALAGAVIFPLAAHQAWGLAQIFWVYWLALGVMVSLQALYEKYLFKPPVDAAAASVAEASATADTGATKPE